jgi:benzoyl-CoA reductase subunit C
MAGPVKESDLSVLKKYYKEYGRRAKELRGQGSRVMGYLCAFVPMEVIHAAGFLPFRVKGDVREPITKADVDMETLVCPLVRSCYDLSVKGAYGFVEGLVIPHACDSICKTYGIWKYTLNLPYTHLINVPHKAGESSVEYFREVLGTFIASIGRYGGHEITDKDLLGAIRLYNANRERMRKLMGYRKADPPLITGAELTELYVANVSIPVEEANGLLDGAIEEVGRRKPGGTGKKRLMVVGAQVDDATFIDMVEKSGSYVVADDLCPGMREYVHDVAEAGDPVKNLAERYLNSIYCGRTYRENRGDYGEYLEERFGHIGRAVQEYDVDGVILYLYKYCDPYGFEVPAMKGYITRLGVPVLYLEDEYTMSSIGRMKTRVQAFIEMLEE